jgi:hypothetical protein
MSAAERLATLDDLDPFELCRRTSAVLAALVEIMNAETTLLRANRYKDAAALTAEKIQIAQDYVGLSRAVQRRLPQLRLTAPGEIEQLRRNHESLATQMAENLRVIATARRVTETLLTDVATGIGKLARAKTYGATGTIKSDPIQTGRGISINRAL